VLQAALDAAKEIKNEKYRTQALATIAAQIPASEPQLLQAALDAAKEIKDESDRTRALAAVVAQIPASEPQLLQAALNAAFKIEDKTHRIDALSDIAFHSTESLLLQPPPSQTSTLLEIVPQGKNSADRAKLLSALAPRLSIGLFPRALEIIQDFNHPKYQAEALSNLAPYLPTEQLTEALDLVKNHITGFTYPTAALCNLIPRLSLDQLQQALVIAFRRIKQTDLLAQVLQIAAARLCGLTNDATQAGKRPLKSRLIQHILNRTLQLTHEKSIANILIAIAPSLDLSQEWDKIAAFFPSSASQPAELKLKSELYRAQVLAAISSKLSSTEQITFFLQQVNHFIQEQPKATAISAFISFHPDKQDHLIDPDKNLKVIDVVKSLQKDSPNNLPRNTDLALIFATRPPSQTELTKDQTKLLRLIRQQSRDYDKANYLIHLAPHLLPTQALEAQNLAQEIGDAYHQAKTLIALSTRFPQVRGEARTKIDQIQYKKAEYNKGEEAKDEYLIQHIELMCEFAIIVPEQISNLLKSIEDWERPEPSTTKLQEEQPDEVRKQETDPNRKNYKRTLILKALKPHLPIRLSREIERETIIGKAPQDLWERSLFVLRNEYRQALKSGSFRNDTAQDEDLLNLKDEINALTEMLLMRDLTPPVAVGILGGWGGGKSYMMHLMQKHMVEIRSRGLDPVEAWGFKDKDGKNPDSSRLNRYVGHIYQIKFDAWTYAKSNLWASLMQTIFFELDRQISLEHQIDTALKKADPKTTSLASQNGEIWQALYEVSDEDREWFLKNILNENWNQSSQNQTSSDQLWTLFANSQAEAIQNLEEIKSDLEKKKGEIQKKSAEILNDQTTDNALFDTVSQKAISILQKRLGKSFTEQIQKELTTKFKDIKDTNGDMTDFYDLVKDDIESVFEKKEAWMDLNFIKEFVFKNYLLILICLLLIFLAVYIPLELAKSVANSLIAQIMTGITPLLAAIPIAQSTIKKGQTLYTQVKLEVSSFTQQLEKNIKHRIDTNPELIQLNQDFQRLEREVKVKSAAIPTNTYASLSDFVKDRVQKGGYQEHLGMMHQVKEDLTMLSKRLLPPPADSKEYTTKVKQLAEVFPRGSARVVLYIDDLDRCPPKTVVEVLEAVQLLVKNPLFIAVLAIDERYITRALADHYKGVLPLKGRPSASDYLEKIIQIPYRIRPISEQALRQYLRAQIVVQDSETSGTKFNEFSPEEFNLLIACCQESELSPRSLKRLTNVYKLYKVLSRTRGQKPTPKDQKTILTLLAFSSRYPELMRDILQNIGSIFDQSQNADNEKETLFNVFKTYLENTTKNSQNSYLAEDVKQLAYDVQKLVDEKLELNEIRSIFDFVRTFSFVGDIGVDHT
jgi:predicted KAP-like P-loop ATPase